MFTKDIIRLNDFHRIVFAAVEIAFSFSKHYKYLFLFIKNKVIFIMFRSFLNPEEVISLIVSFSEFQIQQKDHL